MIFWTMENYINLQLNILENKAPVALTINHDQILLLLVKVPKENQKEKDKIIEWTISKDLNFPIEDCIIDPVKKEKTIVFWLVLVKNQL